VTAATGLDALTHAIEAYTCLAAGPLTDTLALRAVELVHQHLERAAARGSDLEARTGMLLASLLAGMAFGNSDVGAVHCLGETLGGLYDTPHGLACAVFLPDVFDFNRSASPERHATVARALGVTAPDEQGLGAAAVAEIRRLLLALGVPRFRDLPGVSPADFPALARGSAEHVCSPDNARPITEADYLALIERAYGA
jgi:alcohol dehydrogenase